MPFWKGCASEDRRKRARAKVALDRAESAAVRERSAGRCEVVVDTVSQHGNSTLYTWARCAREASEVHHMKKPRLSNPGREVKQHVCKACHDLLGGIGGRLTRVDRATNAHFTDSYERTR